MQNKIPTKLSKKKIIVENLQGARGGRFLGLFLVTLLSDLQGHSDHIKVNA